MSSKKAIILAASAVLSFLTGCTPVISHHVVFNDDGSLNIDNAKDDKGELVNGKLSDVQIGKYYNLERTSGLEMTITYVPTGLMAKYERNGKVLKLDSSNKPIVAITGVPIYAIDGNTPITIAVKTAPDLKGIYFIDGKKMASNPFASGSHVIETDPNSALKSVSAVAGGELSDTVKTVASMITGLVGGVVSRALGVAPDIHDTIIDPNFDKEKPIVQKHVVAVNKDGGIDTNSGNILFQTAPGVDNLLTREQTKLVLATKGILPSTAFSTAIEGPIEGVVYRYPRPVEFVLMLVQDQSTIFSESIPVLQTGITAVVPISSNPISGTSTAATFEGGVNLKYGRTTMGILASTQPSGDGGDNKGKGEK